MAKSPEFKKPDIITLRQRAGEMCSRCKKETGLPYSTPDKSITLGEAAHIRAARPGEARYVPSMTDEERGLVPHMPQDNRQRRVPVHDRDCSGVEEPP